jgi:HAD superfamily hydrolase (TIGR01509 family)
MIPIWDFDGVIGDTKLFNLYAVRQSFKMEGMDFPDAAWDYLEGKTLQNGLADYLKSIGKLNDGLINTLITHKKSFDPEYAENITPYPDALGLIEFLKQQGCIMVLATGARRGQIDQALEKFNLKDVFSIILTAEDYHAGKPDPEIYHTAISRLREEKLLPEDNVDGVFVIEDSPAGVEAANAAGLPCLAVTHTHSEQELIKADLIVNDLLGVDPLNSPEGNRLGPEME